MSDVDFSNKEQLLAAREGLRRGLVADSQADMHKEQERRELLYSLSDEDFLRLLGRSTVQQADVVLESITD